MGFPWVRVRVSVRVRVGVGVRVRVARYTRTVGGSIGSGSTRAMSGLVRFSS